MRVECSGARNRDEPRELNVERVGEAVLFSFSICPKMPAAGGCERPGMVNSPSCFLVFAFRAVRKIRTAHVNMKLESSGNNYNSLCSNTLATCDMPNEKSCILYFVWIIVATHRVERESRPSENLTTRKDNIY